jgi:hypothetical protein
MGEIRNVINISVGKGKRPTQLGTLALTCINGRIISITGILKI